MQTEDNRSTSARRIRVIPVLQIDSNIGLVKSIRFGKRTYIGDPINAVKIFNDKGVDELVLLDIDATRQGRAPNFAVVEDIVSEAFMPVGYGGGVTTVEQMTQLLRAGAEKIIINSAAVASPDLISKAAARFGSQSVVVSIDVKNTLLFGARYCTRSGRKTVGDPVTWAKRCEELGAGEIILTAIDREGTYKGYDLKLLSRVSESVKIPVVANGGAQAVSDFEQAVKVGRCSAVAAASMFVFAAPSEGVLINFPSEQELRTSFWEQIEV